MKVLLIFLFISFNSFSSELEAIEFIDSNFYKAILTHSPRIDIDNNGILDIQEALNTKELNLMGSNIFSLDDLRHFVNVKSLIVTKNNLTELKIINYPFLEKVYCAKNKISSVKIVNCPKLTGLFFGLNNIERVKLKKLPLLESIDFRSNRLRKICLKRFVQLKTLRLNNNNLKKVDLSRNKLLEILDVTNNRIEQLDITNLINLNYTAVNFDSVVFLVASDEQKKKLDSERITPPVMIETDE